MTSQRKLSLTFSRFSTATKLVNCVTMLCSKLNLMTSFCKSFFLTWLKKTSLTLLWLWLQQFQENVNTQTSWRVLFSDSIPSSQSLMTAFAANRWRSWTNNESNVKRKTIHLYILQRIICLHVTFPVVTPRSGVETTVVTSCPFTSARSVAMRQFDTKAYTT